MSNFYYYRLDDEAKKRYLHKLDYSGVTLPDPLDTDLRLRLFKSRYHLKINPNITFGDIYIYLVETEHVYSREEFKNYKTLDCYKMISNRKVKDILAYKCDNTKMCVLTCDIQDLNPITAMGAKMYRPWAVISCEGVIQNGHCTCMEGFEKVCSHVAALLLSLEIAIKNDFDFDENSEEYCSGEIAPRNISSMPLSEVFGNNKKHIYSPQPTSNNPPPPTADAYKKFLEILKKLEPHAPIFTLLSDSDFSANEEEDIEESNL